MSGTSPTNPFTIKTAISTLPDARSALDEIAASLSACTLGLPNFISLHYGSARDAHSVWRVAMGSFPGAVLHGGSSCLGMMSEKGVSVGGMGIGAFAIWDAKGAYGSAMAALGSDPRQAAISATNAALARAGRSGEAPEIVWLTAAPGHEEAVLKGIQDAVGCSTLILGGSSAANGLADQGSQLSNDGADTDSVVISVMFPSTRFGHAFESGFVASSTSGTVTGAMGRIITHIDERAAADVYCEWVEGTPGKGLERNFSIFSRSALFPLGWQAGQFAGDPIHLLAHPAAAHPDGSLALSAEIGQGEQVWLMRGSRELVKSRAARVAGCSRQHLAGRDVAGALIVFCAGCMLAARDELDDVLSAISRELEGAPFMAVFSFGEQGELPDGNCRHSTMMIGCVSFAGLQSERN